MVGPDDVVTPIDVDSDVDLADVLAVMRQCELDAMGHSEETLDGVRATLTSPAARRENCELVRRAGEAVAVVTVELDPHGREFFVDAYAITDDRSALHRLLLGRALDAARWHATANPTGQPVPADPYVLSADVWQVVSGCPAQEAEYAEVLAGQGYREIRHFWRMRWDLADASAHALQAPAGVARRRVDGEDDLRAMHAAFTSSFADHFGSTHDHPYEQWLEEVRALPGHDPQQWWLATLDGEVVGLCLTDDSRAPFGDGYVRTLGVVAGARGRGIGRWLLHAAAADAVAAGRTGLALTVDSANATGATALYESVGFALVQQFDVWCLPLLP